MIRYVSHTSHHKYLLNIYIYIYLKEFVLKLRSHKNIVCSKAIGTCNGRNVRAWKSHKFESLGEVKQLLNCYFEFIDMSERKHFQVKFRWSTLLKMGRDVGKNGFGPSKITFSFLLEKL